MSRYTAGWTWRDDATEEQMTADNTPLLDAYATRIAELWRAIPDPGNEYDQERRAEALDCAYENALDDASLLGLEGAAMHKHAEAVVKATQEKRAAQVKLLWDEIEFFEGKLDILGARLRRPYEHWNEDEALVAHQEGEPT